VAERIEYSIRNLVSSFFSIMDPIAAVQDFRSRIEGVKAQMARVIVGQEQIVEGVLMCLCAGGHVLLEGVPGLGKTLLVRTLAGSLGLDFSRIQFTPDLMPADVTGTNIIAETAEGRREFQFQRGPVFTNVLLADEINRATPKTQSALLEAMQEHCVTVAGTTYTLTQPFIVLATQNPIEMEGHLSSARSAARPLSVQDEVYFPDLDEMMQILDRTTSGTNDTPDRVLDGEQILGCGVLCGKCRLRRISRVRSAPGFGHAPRQRIRHTQRQKFARYGASPRGAQALILSAKVRALLQSRYNVAYEDIDFVARPALRHRIILNFEGQAEGVETDDLVDSLVETQSAVAAS
jgi:MoxR-like ATPase